MTACRIAGVLLSVLIGLITGSHAAEPLKAGVAVVDITPPAGYRMAGYYSERRNTGTHDPLLAKAIVFQQGDVRAALVECDIVSMPAAVSSQARARAEKSTGIPARQITVAATHSQPGPLFSGPLRKLWNEQAVAKTGGDCAEAVDSPTV